MGDAFVHLHNHSMASLLDGFSTPHEIASRAAELGQSAIAITDHGSMAATIMFYEACRDNNIKPLFGVEAYITPDIGIRDKDAKIYHGVFIARNIRGLTKLFKLSEIAWTSGFYKKPRLDVKTLRDVCGDSEEDIIWLTGCIDGVLSHSLRGDSVAAAIRDEMLSVFKYRFAEIQPWNDKGLNDSICEFAESRGLDVVATSDAHYPSPAEKAAAEVALLLSQFSVMKKSERDVAEARSKRLHSSDILKKIDELWPHRRLSFSSYQNHISSRAEMSRLMGGYDFALDNTIMVSELCDDISLDVNQTSRIPRFDRRHDSAGLLKEIATEGLQRLGLDNDERYVKRLEEELLVVTRLGFADYFLIIWDMVHVCRASGIMVGPGRGSVGGSLLAYCLGITEIDPVRFNLTFWRFLNVDFEYDPKFSVISSGDYDG